ncbi:ribulokinase [Plebeiibacterium sediminum]|uniref:Ribulokinase n=1 Tax=Plebeiibacterium sediminum TaxID=2992112 RepID=A0AAE3M273_9BACT|nr:ribulokinase [Plebeiobacterium sediminum]MCW3785601.1 ribulokinase [Plebeiobacterium sediminum]
MKNQYVIGLDYGSDSARALIVDVNTGEEMASSVKYYPRWMDGKYCVPAQNQYRQHPKDYLEVMEATITEALAKCDASVAENVVGISFDTTGSTPALTDANGTPLAMLPEFEENPNAMFILWKDHTAVKEADEINALARKWDVDFTKYEGGIYSSEWVWAKVLHILRKDEVVKGAAVSWIEYCDWLPAVLTGKTALKEVKRSRCAAGHKALWHTDWNGLPPEEFLVELGPELKGLRENLFEDTYTSDEAFGTLTPEWAEKLGLSTDVVIGVSAFDAHMGAVGAEIEANTFVRIMGTSTCDIMVSPEDELGDKLIPGICGQVDGSVIPGMVGLEAGQSAFGDVYAWFKNVLAWPLQFIEDKDQAKAIEDKIIPALSEEAIKIPVEESTILATDWLNGRRTPDATQNVKGTITGLNLGSSAPRIFRALVEATAFGSKAIVQRFLDNGVKVDQVVAIGGVAKKSDFVMQTLADVLGMPIKVARSEQSVALGAAMFAAVASGAHKNIAEAQKAMGQGFEKEYDPIAANVEAYKAIYDKYLKLGAFTEKEL